MSDQIPLIIAILFLIAILFPIGMIANIAKKADFRKTAVAIVGFYISYLFIVSIIGYLGYFDELTLPPKIIQITTIPLLIFLLGVISFTKTYRDILTKTNLSNLVGLHIFRLMGSFFIILMLFGTLPVSIGLIAGLGDIITAVSSIWVAKYIAKEQAKSKNVVLAWNTFGLLDILITSATAILLTKHSMDTGSMGVEILATFPFCFIPAFAPATIIFLHISVYRKVLIKKYH
ncbi:MAG: hypothetical protein AAFQ94_12300 [Bacteroidota bacterium]